MHEPLPSVIHWQAPEHHHTEKNSDWYWIVGIIAATALVVAILLHNYIFAVLIFFGTIALLLNARQEPKVLNIDLNKRGIIVDHVMYPYETLDSFWVEDMYGHPRLLVKSKKFFVPYIVLLLDEEIDPETLRDFLFQYLPEEEHHEPFFQQLLENLGF